MVPNNHLQEWLWFLLSSEGNVSREEPHTVLHSVGKTPIHINVKHKSNQQQQKHSKFMVKDNSIYQKLFPSRTWKVIISAVWLSLMLYCKQNWGIWLWPSSFILYSFVNIFISSAGSFRGMTVYYSVSGPQDHEWICVTEYYMLEVREFMTPWMQYGSDYIIKCVSMG